MEQSKSLRLSITIAILASGSWVHHLSTAAAATVIIKGDFIVEEEVEEQAFAKVAFAKFIAEEVEEDRLPTHQFGGLCCQT
jgi:hypothetical protein